MGSNLAEHSLERLDLLQARDPSAKAIVFSQFVNMLDLIMWRLTLEGIKVCVEAVIQWRTCFN